MADPCSASWPIGSFYDVAGVGGGRRISVDPAGVVWWPADAVGCPDILAPTAVAAAFLVLVSKALDPDALTPAKVHAMTDCGVNLFGFDQILPEDGRIQSSLWTWAPDEPKVVHGGCTLQGADGRWVAAQCTSTHPAACAVGSAWSVTAPVTFADAPAACSAIGASFGLPRVGDQNSRLHAVAGPAGGAWVDYQFGS